MNEGSLIVTHCGCAVLVCSACVQCLCAVLVCSACVLCQHISDFHGCICVVQTCLECVCLCVTDMPDLEASEEDAAKPGSA